MRLMTMMICLAAAGVSIVGAQSTPTALFAQSILTGSNNTITATQVPIVTSSGAVVYLNATIQFNVDGNGNLTISSGFPQITPAPALLTSGFKAGNYVGTSTSSSSGIPMITVSGPGVTDGGATEWSIAQTSGSAGCTYPTTATFYVGPLASNPLAPRLSKAGITSTSYSYGLVGSGSTCFPGTAWYSNSIIGLSQNGNTITIVSFTKSSNADSNVPLDQITYTLAPTQ